MANTALIQAIDLPFCQALMLESWDPAPGRFFAAYRARHGFTALLGNCVVDEFRTISGPILLPPTVLLGGIYDAGMRLAEARDIEAPIDQGWPPLTVGIDVAAPDRPDDWMTLFLAAMTNATGHGAAPWAYTVTDFGVDDYNISGIRCIVDELPAATVIVTDAPVLPQQLEQLADADNAPVTITVSTGNRLPRIESTELHQVDAISEQRLAALVAAASGLF